ncbi:hypothetical protein VTL71DRAFT_3772 [Oculimacula yallundae]|uniref:2EXR domain-containing protein n=1 Tax=Oculimacula yallundae TaxID=86028 RepID=A0ABR4C3Y2_9HELO
MDTHPRAPLDSFTLFPWLPIELRLKVWEHALPGPRVIEIDWQQPSGIWVCRHESQTKPSGLLRANRESREKFLRVYSEFLEVTTRGVVRGGGEGEDEGEDGDEDGDEGEDKSESAIPEDDEDEDGKEDGGDEGEDVGEQDGKKEVDDVEDVDIENEDDDENAGEEAEIQEDEDDQEDSNDEEASEAEAAYWAENPGFDPETGEPYLSTPVSGSRTYINPLIDTLYICGNRQSEITVRPQSMEALVAMPCLATLERLACECNEVEFGWNSLKPPEAIASFLPCLRSLVVVVGDTGSYELEWDVVDKIEGEIEFRDLAEGSEEYQEEIEAARNLFLQPDRRPRLIVLRDKS